MTVLKLSDIANPWQMERCRWAPIFLRPIVGSDELFVVGALATDGSQTYFAQANALRRLECLYGKSAAITQFIAETAFSEIRDLLKEGSDISTLRHINPHVEVGEWRDAEGDSPEEVAKRWLSVSSSLYDEEAGEFVLKAQIYHSAQTNKIDDRRIHLRANVFDFVAGKKPLVATRFSNAVQHSRSVRRKKGAISIDFMGQALTANIEDVGGSQPWRTIVNIKERLWDLSVAREKSDHSATHSFEMLVCAKNSKIDLEQQSELIEELTEQADIEELRLREFSEPFEIGQHILKFEAA